MRAFSEPRCNAATLRPLARLRHLLCLAALLIPFTTRAQVGVIDHDWSFILGSGRYGAIQVTYPGAQTYTYFYFGKAQSHVHARTSLLAISVLPPLATAILLLAWLGPKRRPGAPVSDPASP